MWFGTQEKNLLWDKSLQRKQNSSNNETVNGCEETERQKEMKIKNTTLLLNISPHPFFLQHVWLWGNPAARGLVVVVVVVVNVSCYDREEEEEGKSFVWQWWCFKRVTLQHKKDGF